MKHTLRACLLQCQWETLYRQGQPQTAVKTKKKRRDKPKQVLQCLSNLFDINDVLGIFSVWTNNLSASSNLERLLLLHHLFIRNEIPLTGTLKIWTSFCYVSFFPFPSANLKIQLFQSNKDLSQKFQWKKHLKELERKLASNIWKFGPSKKTKEPKINKRVRLDCDI